MVDEKAELPIVEEPTAEVKKEPKRNVDDLLAELEKVGIENPQQLQGKLDAGAQAGRLAQLLGDEKKTVTELQTKIDKLMTQSQPVDETYYPEGRPINIQDEVRQGVRQELAEQQKAMRQAQDASIQAYNTITTDKNFHLVKEVWDEKVKNPTYVYQAQSGQLDPIRDYQNMVVDYYKKIAQESHKTIKELVGGTGQPAPHLESGETQSHTNIVSEVKGESANRKFLNAMQKKVDKGYLPTDEENALIAEAVLAESLEV